MSTTAVPRVEMLQVAEAVAREKAISKAEVLEALEAAISKAARAKYGPDYDIRASVDPKSGQIGIARYREVVDSVEEEDTQVSYVDASVFQPGIQVGEFLIEELPPIDLGRISAQSAKQVIVQRVRDAERKRYYEEYKDRNQEIISGVVRRIEYRNVFVELNGGAEAILRRDEQIPRETFSVGDRVRALIYDVREETRGPQIFLSRTHPMFLAKLFVAEVPEIYEGTIVIKAVARDPGSRAKMAVHTEETMLDPVGACVGMRGSRVLPIVQELQGEKVDIIPWSEDIATFVVNALAPAQVSKLVLDEEGGRLETVVPDDQLSLAIGRRGQNVRLAANLTGWEIDILTEEQESERRSKEYQAKNEMFVAALDVDDMIAQLLINEGFSNIQQVAFLGLEELTSIEGFDEDLASELQTRAQVYLDKEQQKVIEEAKNLGLMQDLIEFVERIDGFTQALLLKLVDHKIFTLDDLADLASDELVEILGEDDIDEEAASAIIMAARAHWFEDQDTAQDTTGGEGSSDNEAAQEAVAAQGEK